jgi:D-serine dehydratase
VGTVVSRPEPGLALLNLGRRDVSHDQDLPVPVRRARRGGPVTADVGGLAVTALADQHAFLAVPPDDPLAVGDLVGVGVSHPCTTFDRWPTILVLDATDRVVDLVTTQF